MCLLDSQVHVVFSICRPTNRRDRNYYVDVYCTDLLCTFVIQAFTIHNPVV